MARGDGLFAAVGLSRSPGVRSVQVLEAQERVGCGSAGGLGGTRRLHAVAGSTTSSRSRVYELALVVFLAMAVVVWLTTTVEAPSKSVLYGDRGVW